MANSNKDGLAGSIAGELHIGVQGPPGPVGPQGPVGPVGPEATPLTVTISGTAASHSASEIIAAIKAEKIVEVNMGTERLQVTAWDESAVTVTCKKAPAPNRSGALLSCNEYTISDDKAVTVVANSAISNKISAKSGQAIVVTNSDPSGPTAFGGADIPDIFTAQYGVTTFTEIANAVSAGKTVECRKGYIVLPMLRFSPQASVITFGGTADGQSVTFKVQGETWSSYNAELNDDCVKTVNGIAPDENGNVVVSGGGLSATASGLLIEILRNGVYSTDQSANITALATALSVTEPEEPDTPVEPDEPVTPEKTLSSISATYSGGDVAVGTDVTDLTGIVVTAHYSDGTSKTVTGYTLSGTIAEGSNTVTVSYGGKTTTFAVNGVAQATETEVAMEYNSRFYGNDYSWYSDNGVTEATSKVDRGGGSIAFFSTETFDKDTVLKIYATPAANTSTRIYGASYNETDMHYTERIDGKSGNELFIVTGGQEYEFTYTVRAGYRFVFASQVATAFTARVVA